MSVGIVIGHPEPGMIDELIAMALTSFDGLIGIRFTKKSDKICIMRFVDKEHLQAARMMMDAIRDAGRTEGEI